MTYAASKKANASPRMDLSVDRIKTSSRYVQILRVGPRASASAIRVSRCQGKRGAGRGDHVAGSHLRCQPKIADYQICFGAIRPLASTVKAKGLTGAQAGSSDPPILYGMDGANEIKVTSTARH